MLPSRKRRSPRIPLLPTTIKSAPALRRRDDRFGRVTRARSTRSARRLRGPLAGDPLEQGVDAHRPTHGPLGTFRVGVRAGNPNPGQRAVGAHDVQPGAGALGQLGRVSHSRRRGVGAVASDDDGLDHETEIYPASSGMAPLAGPGFRHTVKR